MAEDIYRKLAEHLSTLGMGLPATEALEDILKANFTPLEAEVALALPTRVAPLQVASVDEVSTRINLPKEELENTLEGLAQRGLLFSAKTKEGKKGYALLQLSHGFPQTFFWEGKETPHAKNMTNLVSRYLNHRSMLLGAYGNSETKSFRYIPVGETIDAETQAVYPYDLMEEVIKKAKVIAVTHCPCRMLTRMKGKGCDHPLEVCLKYDDLAEYVIERGLGRRIDKDEAQRIIKMSEEAGLVHFVDNAMGDIKHTCHCCGCACWSVGAIKRRIVPRDTIMATYYLRYTDQSQCTGCEACVSVCPVAALTMEGEHPVVDEDWCIGCGVCIPQCANSAAKLKLRTDKVPPRDFEELHQRILTEKGLR